MAKLIFGVLLLLSFSAPLFSQSFGGSSGPHREGRISDSRDRPIDRDVPLAMSWDATIGKLSNRPDGATIHCFASEGDDLYIAGDFKQFDTVACTNIVHYNRKTKVWNNLNGGPNNVVRAIAVHKGKVYVGGNFSILINGSARVTMNYVSMWDGSTWKGMGGGMNASVYGLAFIGDGLFAGGY